METMTRPTADQLNAHLAKGGQIMVATCTNATLYKPKHAGMFFETTAGSLAVKHGKGSHKLSIGQHVLVGIRLSA